MAVAGDVPNKFDVVLDGEGYCFYRPWSGGESANAPQLGIHSFSPAFVPRTNVGGAYGDDQQDFYLTFSQKDWSLGEQQKYQARDQQATRRYWIGTNVDVRTVGQVSLRRDVRSVDTGASNVLVGAARATSIMLATATNLYEVNAEGTVTDNGAHGLGEAPGTPHGIATDSTDTYITSSGGSSVGVRKWNGSAFSTFSANGAEALAYLNNTLYGYGSGNLYRWSTAGTRSTLFTWQDVDGTALASVESDVQLLPFGGKLIIHFARAGLKGSTWLYDGVGVSKLFDHPANFFSKSICELNGVVFLGGAFTRLTGATDEFRPAIMYYANGSIGLLWQASSFFTWASDLAGAMAAPHDNGIIFTDDLTEKFMWYDASNGGFHSVGSYSTTGTGSDAKLVGCAYFAALLFNDDVIYQFPHNSSFATTGTLTSSLIDFDNSLKKVFSGVKIEYDEGSDGDGGSVDIAYRVNDLDGSYTTLQSAAVAGTEYTFSGVTGRSISIKLTLNKGTSTNGPVLKRIYVRAAPLGTTKHRVALHLDATDDTVLNDESLDPRTGLEKAQALMAAAESETILSYTDALETKNMVMESCELTQIRSGKRDFVASIILRQA